MCRTVWFNLLQFYWTLLDPYYLIIRCLCRPTLNKPAVLTVLDCGTAVQLVRPLAAFKCLKMSIRAILILRL